MTRPLTDLANDLSSLKSLDDLLTDDEKASLNADLAEMARIRRRAETASANLEMP